MQISRRTLNRRALQLGYGSHNPLVCIPLTPIHRRCRLAWCNQYKMKDNVFWRSVIISDESRFRIEFNDERIKINRPSGSDSMMTASESTITSPEEVQWSEVPSDLTTNRVSLFWKETLILSVTFMRSWKQRQSPSLWRHRAMSFSKTMPDVIHQGQR